jgi:hypothetical protein
MPRSVYKRLLWACKSRDSSVDIALGYGLDDRGSRVRFAAGAGNFSLRHRVKNGSGPHPSSYPKGIGVLEVKRQGRETNHSPSSSAEVKELVELYLHSPIRLHAVVLSLKKGTGQLYLYLYLYYGHVERRVHSQYYGQIRVHLYRPYYRPAGRWMMRIRHAAPHRG